MRKSWLLVVVAVLGEVTAVRGGAAVGESDSSAADVRAQVDRTMGAFAAMDAAGFEAGLAEDVVGFEMDLESKPVRLGSRGEAVKYADEMFAQLKGMGARLSLDVHSNECERSAELAYCTIEFDFKAAMENGDMMVQPSRNTVVLRRRDGRWEWVHWHSSLAAVVPPASSE